MVHWGHPMFLGYFGWTTTAPGILGEIITAPLNVNAMTWRTSPAATELETLVIDWLRQWMQLPKDFDGVVYDTASVGVMHALAVAREEAAPGARKLGLAGRADVPTFRIYASEQAHSSAEKAAIALGLGEENVQRVGCDADFRMDVSALSEMIVRDRRAKFTPLATVATVGTTSTASVDPVSEIAKICHEHKMWLHIDGAYGAGLALLPNKSGLPRDGARPIRLWSILTRCFLCHWISVCSTCAISSGCAGSSHLSQNICAATQWRRRKTTWTTASNWAEDSGH
jgi:aromatic-L-amino-acid decarboxylase